MITIGSDHGGFELKKEIIAFLEKKGVEYKDIGVYTSDSVDYPDIAKPVCESVLSGESQGGILLCGTGIGISMAANKFKGIRAALVTNIFSARMAKQHNNANIICMGGRTTGPNIALEMVEVWLDSTFEGGRHKTRVDKIHKLEE